MWLAPNVFATWVIVAALLSGCGNDNRPESTAVPVSCSAVAGICPAYELGKYSNPIYYPVEPTCPILGEFKSKFEFEICRCDTERFVKETAAEMKCISQRRNELLTQLDALIVEVFNCHLEKEGCGSAIPTSMAFGSLDFDNDERVPSLPNCIGAFTAKYRFESAPDAELCRIQIERYRNELLDWAKDSQRRLENRSIEKSNDAVRRFNCYANGEVYCF